MVADAAAVVATKRRRVILVFFMGFLLLQSVFPGDQCAARGFAREPAREALRALDLVVVQADAATLVRVRRRR